ncbi:MAG: hypothetical protein P8Y37_06045, partial [Anaerolineales bacterium]
GCSSVTAPVETSAPATAPSLEATPEPSATQEQSSVNDIQVLNGSRVLTLDFNSLATDFQSETLPAVTDSENAPYWEVLPEYSRVTLEGYPLIQHAMAPQIYIFPIKELSEINDGAGQIVSTLETLLKSPQELPVMPFLPLNNAAQVLHVQVQYLDFQNGKGLRYLAWYSQGIMPVNNYSLIYTYQGITDDGAYYIAAVLPINHPALPEDETVTGNEPPEFASDYPTYLTNIIADLNLQNGGSFFPPLDQLDALVSSMAIQ